MIYGDRGSVTAIGCVHFSLMLNYMYALGSADLILSFTTHPQEGSVYPYKHRIQAYMGIVLSVNLYCHDETILYNYMHINCLYMNIQ